MNDSLPLQALRTDSSHPSFIELVQHLDAVLAELDGPEHAFYAQFHMTQSLRQVVLVLHKDQAIGCGAIKKFDHDTMEIKRMFVQPEFRGRSVGSFILHHLEAWAIESGASRCILETGKRQPDAIRLYLKNGYLPIPNYGPYAGMNNSVCFAKRVK